ncbi:MAG TPA: peroxiredoxin family protein [Pirellulales bacterium]|nr:peroxiredoxin family protein [Pirellulales bacterium]
MTTSSRSTPLLKSTTSLQLTRGTFKRLYRRVVLAAACLGAAAWITTRLGALSADNPRRTPRPSPAPAPATLAAPPANGAHANRKVHFDLLAKLLADDRRCTTCGDKWLRDLSNPKATFRVETQSHPLLDHAATEFTLDDHRGQPWSLQGQLGRGPVVLVFYLGYACSACVHDLFELNADLELFHNLGAEVVAVSADAPSLTRSRYEDYGAFKFPVLSDPAHLVALSYATFRPANGAEPEEVLHGAFVIGRDGQVRWARCGDTPFRNNKTLLYEIARLENKLPPQPTLGDQDEEPETP